MNRHLPAESRSARMMSGFSLIEAVLSTLVVAGLFVAAMNSLAASRASQMKAADRIRGQQLALDLMNEILRQAYQDPDEPSACGPEGAESHTCRSLYDDVDDYSGWSESPPHDKNGNPLDEYTGWTRSVTVEWADPATLAPTPTPDTGIKRITVTLQRGAAPAASLVAYRTAGWMDTIPTPADATGNHPPVAVAAGGPLVATGHITTTFDGAGSTDPDGDTLSYTWQFGDGTAAGGMTAKHTYSTPGTYMATLTVYDGRGGVSSSTLTITVKP